MRSGKWRTFLCLALLTGLALNRCWAQDEEEAADAEPTPPFAYLSLHFSKADQAYVNLVLNQTPPSQEPIRSALGQSLRCPAAQLNLPGPLPQTADSGKFLEMITPDERKVYLDDIAKLRVRQLFGTCRGLLRHSGLTKSASFDFAPLLAALQPAGITELHITISAPDTRFASQSSDYKKKVADFPHLGYYVIPVETSQPVVVEFSIGYSRADLMRAALQALGFSFVPILVIFTVRYFSLKNGEVDRTAAWFGYFRCLQWCLQGTLFVWVFAKLPVRADLREITDLLAADHPVLRAFTGMLVSYGPPLLVYLVSPFASYRVFLQLRGIVWSRREFLLQNFLQIGMTFLPWMFLLAGIEVIATSPRNSVFVFAGAYVTFVVCQQLLLKVTNAFPQAITTGELRDGVFALAARMGVKVQQVFMLPAGKALMANAFAAKNNLVIFTDYLLQRLNKREVNAVAAHELTHLKKKHPAKMGMVLLLVIFSPTLFNLLSQIVYSLLLVSGSIRNAAALAALGWLRNWNYRDLGLIVLGFSVFYAVMRRFEYEADAGAVKATGDPEAKITALLKLNLLNLTPLQWGKATGAWLTHPSTLKRIEHIAKVGGVSNQRLREILAQHQTASQQVANGNLAAAVTVNAQEQYAVPSTKDPGVISTRTVINNARRNLWALVTANVLLPALILLVLDRLVITGTLRTVELLTGFLVSSICCVFLGRWLGMSQHSWTRKQLMAKLTAEGILLENLKTHAVGFSPGDSPRFYLSSYNWESGFLIFGKEQLVYVGKQVRFALSPDQIVSIRLGRGAPSWLPVPRVYVRWKDRVRGCEGCLNFASIEPASLFALVKSVRALDRQLLSWRQRPYEQSELSAQLSGLQAPAIGEVTSRSPREMGKLDLHLKVFLFFTLPLAIAASVLLKLESSWYLYFSIAGLRLIDMIPFWFYREQNKPGGLSPLRTLQVQPKQEQKAKAAALSSAN